MRSDVPVAVAEASERCERPTLLFDRERLVANMQTIAGAARTHGITALFAAKSFPRREVWELAASIFDGFDAASRGEVETLPSSRVLSIIDPSGCGAQVVRGDVERLIVGCETVEQVRAAPGHADIAIRISASIAARDPAIGAVLDGTGHRRSRFGLDVEQLWRVSELATAARSRRVGLHVHHGAVTATSVERFVASVRAMLDVAERAGVAPSFLDVGGAWHGLPDIAHALGELRAAVPRAIELVIEPGRAIAAGAGFACGRVVVARELDDRPLRVLDVSRICHLRWSPVELVGVAPRPGAGRVALFVGPTCFEDDVVGEWAIETGHEREPWSAGSRVVLRHVSGYAVAWNTGFGGVPPADVQIV